MESPVDDNVEFRFTCVLHLEHGDWKIVQWHSSIPASNEQYGFFLTKSVDDIVEAVSESRPDLSASSAEDGTVTIAFTDIEDSMRLNAFLGDRRWLDVLRAHNEVVKRTTEDAARVASAAVGGEIVVSSLVHGLLAQTGEFEFDTAREVELKGIEGAQHVYPLVTQPLATVD
jgi:class 3 adenylate cyclase